MPPPYHQSYTLKKLPKLYFPNKRDKREQERLKTNKKVKFH
jgi:hypothetical protein